MTGYGRGSAPLGEGRLDVEIRTLNHRFLEVRTRAPRGLPDVAMEVESLARARLRRGRVEVQVSLEGPTGARAVLDRELARDAMRALAQVRDEIAPGEPLPLSVLAAVPDLFAPGKGAGAGPVGEALRTAFGRAADALDGMRTAEGANLARDIAARLANVRKTAEEIRRRVPDVLAAQRARLVERTARLLGDAAPPLDEARLEQEIALLADRSDVSEELARLDSHCDQLGKLLEATDDVGRRIEFLLQELGREANTIGAKSQNAAIAHVVVDLKVEIERMREQSQNVE